MDGGAACIVPFFSLPLLSYRPSDSLFHRYLVLVLFCRSFHSCCISRVFVVVVVTCEPVVRCLWYAGKINLHTTDTVRWDWASMILVLQVAR